MFSVLPARSVQISPSAFYGAEGLLFLTADKEWIFANFGVSL